MGTTTLLLFLKVMKFCLPNVLKFASYLHRIADDFETHSQEALIDPESHLANPVNAYLLIKRFTIDWKQVVDRYLSGAKTQGKQFNKELPPVINLTNLVCLTELKLYERAIYAVAKDLVLTTFQR